MAKRKRPALTGIGDTIFGMQSQPTLLVENLLPRVAGLTVEEVLLDSIEPNPYQPRDIVEEDDALRELAASIRERGVLQPIRIRPHAGKYQLIAGERRWRACRLAGLAAIPAVIAETDDDGMRVEALIENLQREDLNDIERARALRQLKEALSLTWDEVAAKVGLTRRSVMRIVGLMSLPEPVQALIGAGKLTEKHGRALRQLATAPEQQLRFADEVVARGLSGDETLRLVTAAKCDPRVTLDDLLADGDPRVTLHQVDQTVDKATSRVVSVIERSAEQLGKLLREVDQLPVTTRARNPVRSAVQALSLTVQALQDALE